MTEVALTIIEARPKTLGARLFALWQYRGFYALLLKELTLKKARGTLLGVWWLIIRPLIPAVVAVVTFTFIIRIDTHGLPYVIFFFSGFTTWQIFQGTVGFMPRTLLWMRGMMRRTYFPKLLVPLAAIGPPLIELAITCVLFAAAVVFIFITTGTTHLRFGWVTLWFPACLFLALLFGLSFGMVLSVIALFFRDIIFTVSYFTQLMLFLTPILYPVKLCRNICAGSFTSSIRWRS